MTRHFDLDEAQSLIPRLTSLMSEAIQLHSILREAVEKLGDVDVEVSWSLLRREAEIECEDEEEEELVRQELEKARLVYDLLKERVEGVEQLGAEVRGVVDGLVDFPTYMDGKREVLLTWRIGERSISYYHEPECTTDERKPIRGHEFSNHPLAEAPEQATHA